MKKRTLACLGLLGFMVAMGMADQVVPVAVSPGRAKGVAVVNELCPTFSWTAVDWAVSYRLAVFEALGVAPVSYEQMASSGTVPVLAKEIEGRGLSWTPSSEEGLPSGGMYVWYVEAMSPSGPGVWSSGRVFIVSAAVGDAAIEERVTKVLRERGIREEVVTDVVKEMKGGGTAAAGGDIATKPGGNVRTTGYEGEDNTFYGNQAGWSITEGGQNVFIGRMAGYNNTLANFNTFVGNCAGSINTTGASNTFVGDRAGNSNTTASDNTCLGYFSGYANSTGHDNSFLGYLAGWSNTTGNYNTFLGANSGSLNTTGYNNTCLGFKAGYTNAAGHDNTFLGYQSGYTNSAGNFNTFIGKESGYCGTTGSDNTFVGIYTGYSNTTGGGNTFIGKDSGGLNTTGGSNTLLGVQSGFNNVAGNSNVFLGYRAGYNETGSNRLYISNSEMSFPLVYGDFNEHVLAVNGRLGVGIQNPTYPMELKTTGRNATFILQRSDGGALNFINATAAFGQFGTGNNFPVRIQVNNAWKLQLEPDNTLYMASGAICTAGGVWTNASSRELKENFIDLTADKAKETLAGLSPVIYNYKADKAEHHVGFIAEDVPDLVASKDRKTLSPMDVVAVLTKVVQEQQKLLSDYQKSLVEQQKTIAELKSEVAELKKGKPQK